MSSPAGPASSSPSPTSRPRAVDVAFWLLIVAGIALLATGMLLALLTSSIPVFVRGTGVFALAGVALMMRPCAREWFDGPGAFR